MQNQFNFIKTKESNMIIQQSMGEIDKTYQTLEPGVYTIKDVGGPFRTVHGFDPIEQKDKLVTFTDGVVADILVKTSEFFSQRTKDIYSELKLVHKMGMLLYGPPGTGKTCTVSLVMNQLVNQYGAICLDCTNSGLGFIKRTIQVIRKFQDNPIIVFVDEFEEAISNDEHRYLTFLDGNDSVDNLVVIGCTNYLDQIPARISKRKSRIKHLIEVKSFPAAVYREYILDRLPSLTSAELAEFSFLAVESGLTLDNLKHAVIDYKIEGVSIAEAIAEVVATSE